MDFESYQSPFTWRYGSPEMRAIWGEANRRRTWRRLWADLAQTEAELGVISAEQAADLRQHQQDVDLVQALEKEASLKHDLMAEVVVFASQCPLGGGILHLGATSMDIKDNADVLLARQALGLLLERLKRLLVTLAGRIEETAALACLAFTHLQPAEPTTLGYRLANYAQDLLVDWETLRRLHIGLKGKGFRGAVGTAASYVELVGYERFPAFEQRLGELAGLDFFAVSNQTAPRKQDLELLNGLAGLGNSLYRMAFDLRLLQSPMFGEVSEAFGKQQVGSSAMPFKRNPVRLEAIDSLARLLARHPQTAWDNAAHSLLERTLDDSANRRVILPEAFLAADELLVKMDAVLGGLQIYPANICRNLAAYAPFALTEPLLMRLVRAGADRQLAHERLRELSLQAWQQVQAGQANDLVEKIAADEFLGSYLPREQLLAGLDINAYLGIAQAAALKMARNIQETIAQGAENG